MLANTIYALLLENGKLMPLAYDRGTARVLAARWQNNVRRWESGLIRPPRLGVAMVKIVPKKIAAG